MATSDYIDDKNAKTGPGTGVLARILGKLSGLRLRVTLCRIRAVGPKGPFLRRMAGIDDSTLIVDVEPDGSALALYVGPRHATGADPDGDRAIERLIIRRLNKALSKGPLSIAPDSVQLTVLHRWADSIGSGVSLFTELSQQLPQRLAEPPLMIT